MYQNFSTNDAEKLKKLSARIQTNNDFAWLLCDYLNNTPCLITKELMAKANPDGALPEETIFHALLAGICNLNPENSEYDKLLINNYLRKAVRQLNAEHYTHNYYYQSIKIPETRFGNWHFGYQKYEPYEAFIYKDLIVEPEFTEFPGIGFFNQEFRYPSVMENAHEWMSIKPSEIESTQPAIDAAQGNVITFGLGLGYFAYMAAIKPNVSHVTIVERDAEVIELFKCYILPQFKDRQKVDIVEADAFEYAKKQMPAKNYSCAFVDLWHDVSDGLEMYLTMKKLERLTPQTTFLYWIEDSLLSGLRWQIFDLVIKNTQSYSNAVKCLGKPFLQKFAATELQSLSHLEA